MVGLKQQQQHEAIDGVDGDDESHQQPSQAESERTILDEVGDLICPDLTFQQVNGLLRPKLVVFPRKVFLNRSASFFYTLVCLFFAHSA